MSTEQSITDYINSLPEAKQHDIETLHQHLLKRMPHARLWFEDGKNEEGKVISNPNIGYGEQKLEYANGKTRTFYQIGISANQTGISIYLIGLPNKSYLIETYSNRLGKAKITGYCIKFKLLKHIDLDVLDEAIEYALAETSLKE